MDPGSRLWGVALIPQLADAVTSIYRSTFDVIADEFLSKVIREGKADGPGDRSTLLNESGKWQPDAIEAELGHVGADFPDSVAFRLQPVGRRATAIFAVPTL
ncbi:MAG: hypothetical protein E5Y61_15525 [Mesorhizobium sp.]|nr:MAG: hypothetical protein E5Y61_15525 [Mesorhizobium sp.]TIM71851.1 MAG: hypothetical protein E5Y60_12665 [Mesorhizobium sp.]